MIFDIKKKATTTALFFKKLRLILCRIYAKWTAKLILNLYFHIFPPVLRRVHLA